MQKTDPLHFDAIGFAGGGNRCYWQGGFWKALTQAQDIRPDYIVALSGGAYQACFNVIGMGDEVRAAAFKVSADLKAQLSGVRAWNAKPAEYFRHFLRDIFGADEIRKLHQAPKILIQLSHPPEWLSPSIAAPSAILLYQLEKLVRSGNHSRAGRHLGFSASWASTHDIDTPENLVEAIMSSSAVPPFLPVGRYGGRICLDGGFVDNPPLEKLGETERNGGTTLLLTTRFGRHPVGHKGRLTVGPSANLRVNKFTVRDPEGLRQAYELGLTDGLAFVSSRR